MSLPAATRRATCRISLPGVAAGAPLGAAILHAVSGDAEVLCDPLVVRPNGRWSRVVAGTALQWWSASALQPAAIERGVDICLDLHASAAPASAETDARQWRIVDGSGTALLGQFHGLAVCRRPPFVASLYLLERQPDGSWQRRAEAHPSSAVSYPALLGSLGRAAAVLIRRALQTSDAAMAPWHAAPASPRRRAALARTRVAHAVAWIGARAGGDLYGIAVLPGNAGDMLKDAVLAPPRWLGIPKTEGFLADPFFWPGQPGVVLCEQYTHASGRGHLAAIDLLAAEPKPAPLLVQGHHLSYPFAFADRGRAFFLPEMAEARRQLLFELVDGEAIPAGVVAEDVSMADPTLMRMDGRYWLSYTDAERNAYDNLCLMYAERVEGPWRKHPGNPVKLDARSSRPGGTPFRIGGRLFRPAQDCSRTYGGALAINEVLHCTPDGYSERVVATLRPDRAGPYPDGVHTLAVGDNQMLIDGKRISFHPAILGGKLLRRMQRAAGGGYLSVSPISLQPAAAKSLDIDEINRPRASERCALPVT